MKKEQGQKSIIKCADPRKVKAVPGCFITKVSLCSFVFSCRCLYLLPVAASGPATRSAGGRSGSERAEIRWEHVIIENNNNHNNNHNHKNHLKTVHLLFYFKTTLVQLGRSWLEGAPFRWAQASQVNSPSALTTSPSPTALTTSPSPSALTTNPSPTALTLLFLSSTGSASKSPANTKNRHHNHRCDYSESDTDNSLPVPDLPNFLGRLPF